MATALSTPSFGHGFSKTTIGISLTVSLWSSIFGGFVGGAHVVVGINKAFLILFVMHIIYPLFAYLSTVGKTKRFSAWVVSLNILVSDCEQLLLLLIAQNKSSLWLSNLPSSHLYGTYTVSNATTGFSLNFGQKNSSMMHIARYNHNDFVIGCRSFSKSDVEEHIKCRYVT